MLFWLGISAIGIIASRLIIKSWLNPLSLYSAIWGFALSMYEWRLIQYEQISDKASALIILAWLSLYLGALLAVMLVPRSSSEPANIPKLRKAILFFCALGGTAFLLQLRDLISHFGTVAVILSDPGSVYAARTSNDMPGTPYIGSLTYAACCLSGIYLARTGSLGVGVIAVALIGLQHFFAMGRTGLGITAILFMACCFYSSRISVKWTRRKKLILAISASVLFAGFFGVTAIRHLQVDFVGQTPEMNSISEYVPFFPSIYSNFSATPVAFSLYLDSPETHGAFAQYTFAPILRFLSAFGFQTSVPPYEENYYTPVPVNTSTYLKNAYSDFGLSGIVLVPFMLGLLTIGLLQFRDNPVCLVIAAHLAAVLAFSIFFDIMLLGDWWISLTSSVIAARFIRRPDYRKPHAS